MASRLPDSFSFCDWQCLGPRLRRIIEPVGRNTAVLNNVPLVQLVNMYHAAIADAEEQTKKGLHNHASNSYAFGIVVVKRTDLLEMEQFVDLVSNYGDSLLKTRKWSKAIKAAEEMIALKQDCVKGYMLMSKALQSKGRAAVCLMNGMVNCKMTSDDYVDFIVKSSELVGKLKHDLIEVAGRPPSDQLLELQLYCPSLPPTTATWTRILTRLMEQKQFLGMALLTVGFGETEQPIFCLDKACPTDVDCSSGNVEDVYETLSLTQIKKWGDSLASYILDHKGGMGKQAADPLGIHLVRLSLKYNTKRLLKQTLERQTYHTINPDDVNAEGDTALHVLVKSPWFTSLREELASLLIQYGASPNICDRAGKMPHQYISDVGLSSVIYHRLTAALKQPGPSSKTTEELKECGNAEFKKENYKDAIDFYTQAITVMQKTSSSVPVAKGHDDKKHELAVLFSNRAECNLKLGHAELAFSDAKESVTYDPHWYRGHVRKGRALLMKNKPQSAIKAFSNAFNTLDVNAKEVQKKDVLKELVNTVTTHITEQPTEIPNLGFVAPDLWAKVAYDYFCAGNAYAKIHGADKGNPDWCAAEYTFELFKKPLMSFIDTPKIEINLRPLCSWQVPRELRLPIVELILFFLLHGSDHTTLSFYPGDTYLHAASILTFMSGSPKLLDWLMKDRVKPQREENLQDVDGNTALHLFAMPVYIRIFPLLLPPNVRYDLCKILLDSGVNPLVWNNQGQLPIDCLEKKEKAIYNLLEKAMRRAPTPFIPNLKKLQQEPAAAAASASTKVENNSQAPLPAKTVTTQGASEVGTATAPTLEISRQSEDGRRQCHLCQDTLSEAQQCFSRGRTEDAYSKLVSLLGFKHQKDSRHEKFVREALELIVKRLGKALEPLELPDVLLRMSQSHLRQVLEKLASSNQWRQVKMMVDRASANNAPHDTFAENMSIRALMQDEGLCGSETLRLQILNMLMSHGAQLRSPQAKGCMQAAIRHKEFSIVEHLLKLGVEPKFVSMEKGDTPLRAALVVALDQEKGKNFSLFELLVSLFEKDPEKYSYLDLRSLDKDGNTLLHLASQANYSEHSHKAVELLMSKDVPVDVKNKEGKLAADYLKSQDPRSQYLCAAGKQSGVVTMEEKDTVNLQTASSVPLDSKPDDSRRDGNSDYSQGAKPKAEKLSVDGESFKTKDAVEELSSLVESLRELNPAEARQAKASRGNWLEMESSKPLRKESVTFSEEEEEEEEANVAVPAMESENKEEVEKKEEEEEEGEEETPEVNQEVDLLTFDHLEWEVECTAEVWKTLQNWRVSNQVKQRIVHSIKFLASGEWRQHLCLKVQDVADTLDLFKAKFTNGYILWELAIAFSSRLSEDAEKRIDEEQRKGEFAVRGGRMYTEIIRVWDIVFKDNKLPKAIKRIVQSHKRGERCLIPKTLQGAKSQQSQSSDNKRYPKLYSEADIAEEVCSAVQSQQEGKIELYPPASASHMEFHILKFYCFSSTLVHNVLKNLAIKIDFPFIVTDREHAVIKLQSNAPILLLGRSGTGKTTCCLYRLWSRFLVYWTKAKDMDYAAWMPRSVPYAIEDSPDTEEEENPNSELFEGLLDEDANDDDDGDVKGATAAPCSYTAKAARETSAMKFESEQSYPSVAKEEVEDEEEEEEQVGDEEGEEDFKPEASGVQYDHLHQVFVTKNQVLCSEVQKNFRELCHASEVAQPHTEAEKDAMPHRLQDVGEYKFPLFLTSRQLILMLDASLPPPHFFERNKDGSLRVTIPEIFTLVSLPYDSEEEEEDEYSDEKEEGEDQVIEDQASSDHRPKKKDNRREVTYNVFAHEIWPRINSKSGVSYHPSLVWTEIVSFIKGSFDSLTQHKGYLDKERYEKLGRKEAPNFSGNREKVYELFLKYTHYKRQHGLYDEADLVFNIYQRLRRAGPLPWVFHEVFVDETQDFTQAELTVLIRLAHRPNDMFLAGDTAQSIMRGVSFRFCDLKTLFHHAKQSLKAPANTALLEVPRQVYQLTHNYRSHAGILSLASAVIDLLVEFFPESFDRLEKDQGLFDGPQPVVLESSSPADLAVILRGNRRKTSHIDFGTHQVILVANDEARNSLPEELNGLRGLVLTIYEAKGLEFDDVLLYNFFKDSQASKEWRVVTEFLERLSKNEASATSISSSGLVELDEEVLQQKERPRPLAFDSNLHKIVNSELKQLYTAITRARVNVWIFDQDADRRAPMFEYFKARKLVKCVSVQEGEEEGISELMFAKKSSREEWEQRGDEIMRQSLYDVAAKCYALAGAGQKQNIAIAHQRALKAPVLCGQSRKMRNEFLEAAILFLRCHNEVSLSSSTLALRFDLVMKAGACLQNAKENYLAASLFQKHRQFEIAGPLYLRARKWLEASQCFEQMDNFNQALQILDQQEMYEQAIDCLQRYKLRKQELEENGLPVPRALVTHKPIADFTVASFSYKAGDFYHRRKEGQKMFTAIERLPKEDKIKFLQDHELLTDAARLLCDDGRISEAVRMMLLKGRVNKAITIAESGTDNSTKAQCYWQKALKLKAKMTDMVRAGKAGPIRELCEMTGHSKGSVSAALKEAQGNAEGALNILMKKGDEEKAKKYTSMKKFKEKGSEATSSDEEDGDATVAEIQEQMEKCLEKAQQLYSLCKDFSGMGECQLLRSKLHKSKELWQASFNNFAAAQPVPNTAGMLECVEVLHNITSEMDDCTCHHLIWGVENVFDAVRVLLHPIGARDKIRYQVYLKFFGLESTGDRHLVLYPRLKPRCLDMIDSKKLFIAKEKKADRRLKPATDVCKVLAELLIQRTTHWYRTMIDHCGRSQKLPNNTINILSYRIRLDHAVQTGNKSLPKEDVALSKLTRSLTKQDEMWNSVETLLEVIFPFGLLTYDLSSVITLCRSMAGKSPAVNKGVQHQVQRYLQYLWDKPGRVGKGKSINVLEERCKSTNWIVLASLLAPLFKLDIKVDEVCKGLELQLAREMPDWMGKIYYKYALLKEDHRVISLARRHLQALKFLQPSMFDPFEALIKFTKFVKLLHHRKAIILMPDLQFFLFCLEVFVTLALCLTAKIRGNGSLVLPECYSRVLELFSLTLPHASEGDFMQLLENYRPCESQTLKLLHDRIEILMSVLCDGSSGFCLLTHLVQLKKRTVNTDLLTERTLILALTLLVNIEQDNVAARCEAPILQSIHRIPKSQEGPDNMRPRLATLIDKVQAATSYQQVTEALGATLGDMNDCVQFYQWRRNEREKDALISVSMSSVQCGGSFHTLQPDTEDVADKEGAASAEVSQTDDNTEERHDEEEEELSPEEKARYDQELAEDQKQVQQKKAAGVLQKFFRSLLFQKRRGKNCVVTVEHELFSPFLTTDKMCGVCGVGFEKKTTVVPLTEEASAVKEQVDVENENEEDEAVMIAKFRQEHMSSDEHRQRGIHFDDFRKIHHPVIRKPLVEIGAFLSKHQVKAERDNWYKGLRFPVDGVLQRFESLQRELNQAIQHRKWTEGLRLVPLGNELARFFHEEARDPIVQHFKAKNEEQNQMAAAQGEERGEQEDVLKDVVTKPDQAVPRARGSQVAGAKHGKCKGQKPRQRGARGRKHLPLRFQKTNQN